MVTIRRESPTQSEAGDESGEVEESRSGSHGQCLATSFTPPPRIIVLLTLARRAQCTWCRRIAISLSSLSARAKSRRLAAAAFCHSSEREKRPSALLFTTNHLPDGSDDGRPLPLLVIRNFTLDHPSADRRDERRRRLQEAHASLTGCRSAGAEEQHRHHGRS
jgi:hypothetical protein